MWQRIKKASNNMKKKLNRTSAISWKNHFTFSNSFYFFFTRAELKLFYTVVFAELGKLMIFMIFKASKIIILKNINSWALQNWFQHNLCLAIDARYRNPRICNHVCRACICLPEPAQTGVERASSPLEDDLVRGTGEHAVLRNGQRGGGGPRQYHVVNPGQYRGGGGGACTWTCRGGG